MQRYALVTGLSNEEPAIIELLHEGPQRPLASTISTIQIHSGVEGSPRFPSSTFCQRHLL